MNNMRTNLASNVFSQVKHFNKQTYNEKIFIVQLVHMENSRSDDNAAS